jgi:GTP-binding protein Era
VSFRSGFVGIIGRPNVGKSTLLNRLVGQKIAITSPVVQTTRHRIKGVITRPQGQIVFLDTPGFTKPMDKMGEYSTNEGLAVLSEADAFMFVVDGSAPAGKGDQWLAEQLRKTGKFVLLLMNKSDQNHGKTDEVITAIGKSYEHLFEGYDTLKVLRISAQTGKNVERVVDLVLRQLPEGPPYYDDEQVTDQRLRELSAEIIREKILLNTREELPHSVAIALESFDESDPKCTRIAATLYVDQKSQKPMLIGKGGEMIKRIGMQARQEIEELVENAVFLDLNVKVRQNWRKDPQFLKSLGLAPPTS